MNTPDYFLGLDLGQTTDWSALAILERAAIPLGGTAGRQPARQFNCRALKRWPLGTAYPAIVDDVAALVRKPPLRNAQLAVDGTGVGRPVVDMFFEARVPAQLVPVVITAGHRHRYRDGYHHVAKVILISAVITLLQERRLHLAGSLPETATLAKELQNYQVKVTPAANEVFNARQGAHDDLVLAVALAAWIGEADLKPGTFELNSTRFTRGGL